MSLTNEMLSPADIAAVCGNNGNGGNDGMWGNGAWWILILLLFGWGRGGYGGFGGGSGEGGGATPGYVLTSDFANIERKLDGINNGICDSTFNLTNNLNTNFRALDAAICNLGYQGAQHANATLGAIKDVGYGVQTAGWNLSKQISDCCCDLEKANMQNRFDMQAYNCNTLSAIDKVGDRIIDYLANEKTQALRDENFALRLAASQAKQNEYLVQRLNPNPCPTPAYVVSPPKPVSFPVDCCGNVAFTNPGCGF